MTIIGIDPGRNGGIAVQDEGVFKMPKDTLQVGEMLKGYNRPLVFLEKISIRPDDMTFGKASRVQKMLADYERLKGGLEVCGIPYVMVHPMTWQKGAGVRLQGVHEEKAARKRRYKQAAERLYPNIKVALWNADALLILRFGEIAVVQNRSWVVANLPTQFKGIFSPFYGKTD